MQNYQLTITGNLTLEDNLGLLENQVVEILKQYDIAVTEDGVKYAKTLRAEINKGKKAIADAWKIRENEILAPLQERKAKLKEILGLCDEAMLKIDEQVKKFEAGKRAEALKACEAYRDSLCEAENIDPLKVSVAGFDNLTYITASGALSKAGKDAVEAVLNQVKAKILQEELERERLKNELRQEIREEVKQEEVKQNFDNPFENQSKPEPIQEPIQEPMPQAPAGKRVYRIIAQFNVSAPVGMEAKVEDLFLQETNKSDKLKTALKSLKVF